MHRRNLTRVALTAAAAAVFALGSAPAFAVGNNPSTSCGVGNAVSSTNQALGEGIGKAAHELGLDNVGQEVLQPYHGLVKSVC